MALVTEDGTGLANAESYITVADADARRLSFGGDAAWNALTTGQKEAALRKGAEYLEQRYSSRFKGTRLLRAQALSWPRYGAIVHGWDVDSNVVPAAIANANADLALRSITETLNADQTRGIVREKVGPLETEYDAYGSQTTRYVAVDGMLAPYLTGGGMSRLARA